MFRTLSVVPIVRNTMAQTAQKMKFPRLPSIAQRIAANIPRAPAARDVVCQNDGAPHKNFATLFGMLSNG